MWVAYSVWLKSLNTNNPTAFCKGLAQRFDAKQYHVDPGECYAYGYDNSRQHVTPIAVFFPAQHDHVVELIRLARETRTPLTARGRGTGTVGGAVPTPHGAVVSFEKMTALLDYDPDNRVIRAQPGMTNATLQACAAKDGLFWPPDPSSSAYCTLGGNLAYNAAGPRAVKYGTPRENTLGLTAVDGTARTLVTGVKTTKGVVGYDLTRLLIGSEGTLGLITEATLKLHPKLPVTHTYLLFFDAVSTAIQAVVHAMQSAVRPCALEFMDSQALNLIRHFNTFDVPPNAQSALIVELDGTQDSIKLDESYLLKKLQQGSGLVALHSAETNDTRKTLWQARKALSPALRTLADTKINEDVVVPITALPELVAFTEALSKQHDLTILNFGHAGNGNLHVNILYNAADTPKVIAAQTCLHAVFEKVLALGGTLSGEHGVGLAKRPFVRSELSEAVIERMQEIKNVFDPDGILNPDKI